MIRSACWKFDSDPIYLVFALALFGAAQVASAAWVHGKAVVAQRLIAAAWERARGGEPMPRPWPWADLHLVGRLTSPAHGVELFVLDGATQRALAFGPAHLAGTASPGLHGNTVLVAHRDTHFAFLRNLAPGDAIELQAVRGPALRYVVHETAIVHQDDTSVTWPTQRARLTLVTCYPFDAVQHGTPLRYVVVAEHAP